MGKILQIIRCQINVILNALLCLLGIDQLFKFALAHFHNNIGEHLDETAVAVPCPARIAGLFCQSLNNIFV